MGWENEPKDITGYEGFVYKITNLKSGKYYIGKKSFWSNKKLKGLKKKFARENQRLENYEKALKKAKENRLNKNRISDKEKEIKQKIKDYKNEIKDRLKTYKPVNRRVKLESDWREYCGSSKNLLEDIEKHGIENFKKEILILCKNKFESSYQELLKQIEHDVLNDEMSYNGIINVRITRTK